MNVALTDGSLKGFDDHVKDGTPSFLDKREIQEILDAALEGNLQIRQLVDEKELENSVIIRLEETLDDIKRLSHYSRVISH